jgi:hypothetical protein
MKPMSGRTQDEARSHLASSVRAPDYWHINLAEEWEIRFWTREFGIDVEQLRAAVAAVGSLSGAVRGYLMERQ